MSKLVIRTRAASNLMAAIASFVTARESLRISKDITQDEDDRQTHLVVGCLSAFGAVMSIVNLFRLIREDIETR